MSCWCFRAVVRHSNVRCDDDVASCVREAAIKFADQNEDGPLDLILLTGRTALARNSNTLLSVMDLSKPDDIKNACQRDPYLYVMSYLWVIQFSSVQFSSISSIVLRGKLSERPA